MPDAQPIEETSLSIADLQAIAQSLIREQRDLQDSRQHVETLMHQIEEEKRRMQAEKQSAQEERQRIQELLKLLSARGLTVRS